MRKTVRASTHGLQTVEERRKIQGWKKYDEQWQTKAGVSESTLKRFWKSEDLKIDTFTKICEALGFHWETIAESGSLVMGQIICDRYKILELRSDQKHRKIYLGEDLGLPYSPLCLVTQLSHHSSDKEQESLVSCYYCNGFVLGGQTFILRAWNTMNLSFGFVYTHIQMYM